MLKQCSWQPGRQAPSTHEAHTHTNIYARHCLVSCTISSWVGTAWQTHHTCFATVPCLCCSAFASGFPCEALEPLARGGRDRLPPRRNCGYPNTNMCNMSTTAQVTGVCVVCTKPFCRDSRVCRCARWVARHDTMLRR